MGKNTICNIKNIILPLVRPLSRHWQMYALQRKGKSASYKKKCWSVEDQFPKKLYYVLKEKNHIHVEQYVFNYKALKRKS